MFNMNDIPAEEINAIQAVKIRDEIKRRLETVFVDCVEVGWISLYLENRDKWPLITIETNSDSGKFSAGSGAHDDEIRVRATIKVMKGDVHDPDSVLRYCLRKFESLLWDKNEAKDKGGYFLFTPTGEKLLKQSLEQQESSKFVLPEPGLPFASVHLSLKVSYIER